VGRGYKRFRFRLFVFKWLLMVFIGIYLQVLISFFLRFTPIIFLRLFVAVIPIKGTLVKAMSRFSGALQLTDIDDFITPSQV